MPTSDLIQKGDWLRLSLSSSPDATLAREIDRVFRAHSCLSAYSFLSLKRGFLFPRRSDVLCVVYQGEGPYQQASVDISTVLTAHFRSNPGFMDYIALDLDVPEFRSLAEKLMGRLPFTIRGDGK